ncbi:hypothetical protein D623_10017959 [Myotis brandtii]|uniref:Uncharacterized protein n=1 Tax=Myotis brandtii TaxID=109478 RepID=S7MJI4_MYOBR|nr:hypothetical protein D623_10017959 [Myotis brandtii]
MCQAESSITSFHQGCRLPPQPDARHSDNHSCGTRGNVNKCTADPGESTEPPRKLAASIRSEDM